MKKVLLYILTMTILTSCEHTVDGRIRNLTKDTLKVSLTVDLGRKTKTNYRYFDSLTYEKIVRKEGFTDVKTTWTKNKQFIADFTILPMDSIRIFGGLGPGEPGKIFFDAVTIIHSEDTMAYSGRTNIFKTFEQTGKSWYRFDIR